jgi:hypothetical protein
MTPQGALHELLARLGASKGAAVQISEEELSSWPKSTVQAMKAQKLLVRASPAASVVCPGCEQECVMPVHTLISEKSGPRPFIVCDKRDDINRVPVSISQLEQWQATGFTLTEVLRALYGLRSIDSSDTCSGRWEVGVVKGKKGSSHMVLLADGELTLALAGHSIPLIDVLTLEANAFKLDRRRLVRLADKPSGSAGDTESAAQRRVRLVKLVQAEKNRENRAFLKTVAHVEGISVSRLKQILKSSPALSTPRRRRTA